MSPLVSFAIAAGAPFVLTPPYNFFVSAVASILGVGLALSPLFGRGDILSTMSPAREGSLELTKTELVICAGDQRERFLRADVAGGWIEIAGGSRYLVLQMRSGVVVRACLSARQAGALMSDDLGGAGPSAPGAGERMLDDLGLARDPRAMTLRLGSPQPTELGGVSQRVAESIVLGCAGVFTAIITAACAVGLFKSLFSAGSIMIAASLSSGFGVVFMLLITYYLGLRVQRRLPPSPTVARISAEGVELVQRWRRRWISFLDLDAVAAKGSEVLFTLVKGREVAVVTGSDAEANAVVERVREAQTWSRRGSAAARLGELDRGERTLEAWRSALSALSTRGAAGYRDAAMSAETFAEIVEDAAAPTERRVAAAFALASAGKDEALARRVRVAVEATASEPLRIALERAAEGELEAEAVEAALEESRERARSRET